MANFLLLIIFLSFEVSKCLEYEEVILLISEFTSSEIIPHISKFSNYFNISEKSEKSILEDLSNSNFLLLVDLTNSSLYSLKVNSLSTSLRCANLSPLNVQMTDYRFYLHPNPFLFAESALKLINFFSLNKIYLLSSTNHEDLLLSNEISTNCDKIVSFIKYSSDISQDMADQITSKLLKSKGAKSFLIIDSGHSLKVISDSILSRKLNIEGSIFVIIPKITSFLEIPGSLGLIQADLRTSTSLTDFELDSIELALAEIPSLPSRELMLAYLDSKYPSKYLFPELSILNANPEVQVVGTAGQELNIHKPIIFPGNVPIYEPNKKLKIKLSIANGTTEIYSAYKSPLFAYWYKGAEYGVSLFNSHNEIPEYEVVLQPTDCGLYLYDPLYYHSCLAEIQDFGLAYLAPFWQGSANGTYEALSKRSLLLPQISPLSQNIDMDDKYKYPWFLKLSVSASLYFSSAFLYQRSLDWKFINVLATDDPIYQEQYRDILVYSEKMGIKVLNPKEKQVIPSNYTREDFPKYRDYFEQTKANRCRVFIILAYDRGLIWEALYDVGLRKGDFFQIGDSAFLSHLNSDIESRYKNKRTELVEHSFVIAYREWVGNLGQNLYKNLKDQYPDTSYMCFAFDTFRVTKEAIKFLLAKGENHENRTLLAKTMRENRITGCLGNVFFDKESNSRALAEFSIYQIRENKGKFEYVHVAYVNKLGSVMITETNELIWPKSSTPSNFRPVNKCPFDDYKIQNSEIGESILLGICGFFAVLAIISALLSLQRFDVPLIELTEKKQMMFSDILFLSYFAFQTFQLVYFGPDQEGLKALLNNFEALVSMDFSIYFQLFFSKFWILFYCTMSFSFCWSLFCLLIICRWKIPAVIKSRLDSLTEYVMPILGHIAIIPIFSMHLSVFQCVQGTGSGLTESFLLDDCFTFCFKGSHLVAMSVSLFLCSFYLFFAINTRPLWETKMPDLNIKTNSKYLYLLSCFQVFIVLLSKTLKLMNQALHGYVVSFMIFLMIVMTFIAKPYNYPRTKVIQIISLAVSLWAVLIASIFRDYFELKWWKFVFTAGEVLIILLGLWKMKQFPELVAAPPTLDIAQLFLFQFRNNWTSPVKNIQEKPGNDRTPQITVETIQVKTDNRMNTQI